MVIEKFAGFDKSGNPCVFYAGHTEKKREIISQLIKVEWRNGFTKYTYITKIKET